MVNTSEIKEAEREEISLSSSEKLPQENEPPTLDSTGNRYHIGWWKWIIVLSCCVIHILFPMLPSFFGILYAHKVETLKMSSTVVAWIFNLSAFLWNFAGILTGPLCEEFGERLVIVFSTATVSIALLATAFANSTSLVFLLFSVLCGTFCGLSFTTCHLILPQYFIKKRGFIMSIVMAGVSVGQLTLPLFIRYLQDMYGFVGATIIFAAFYFHSVVAALLFHPVRWHRSLKHVELSELERIPTERTKSHIDGDNLTTSNASRFRVRATIKKISVSVLKIITNLKSPVIFIASLSCGCYVSSYLNFILMLPFALAALGYPLQIAAYCISVAAIANMTARLIVPSVSDFKGFRRSYCFILGHLTIGVSIFAFTLVSELQWIMTCMVLYGVGVGTSMSLHMLILIECNGDAQFPVTLGASSFMIGLLFLISGPFVGFIRDLTGSYVISNRLLSLLALFSVLLWMFMPLARSCQKRRNLN